MTHRPLALGLSLSLLAGCAPLTAETRTERGPVLGTFERKVELPGHRLDAELSVTWPELHVRFQRISVCREEKVEVHAEQLITERRSRSAAPTLSTGLVNTLLGGGLLLLRPVFSGEQPRDDVGKLSPSPRQVATGVGLGFLALGLPAAIVGAIDLARSGEERSERRVEDVISLKETSCGAASSEGSVELLLSAEAEATQARALEGGALKLSAEEVSSLPIRAFMIDGDVALLSEEEESLLHTFRACARVLTTPLPSALEGTEAHELASEQLGRARRCERDLPDAPAETRIEALERLLAAP